VSGRKVAKGLAVMCATPVFFSGERGESLPTVQSELLLVYMTFAQRNSSSGTTRFFKSLYFASKYLE
jgi:hypothetical protein